MASWLCGWKPCREQNGVHVLARVVVVRYNTTYGNEGKQKEAMPLSCSSRGLREGVRRAVNVPSVLSVQI